ncbi:hypothetical protein [Haloplanus pelagicus]|jgi:hypothetical protein|uniref:hypothetical protein n=1 Tax=Haloplanus pelagicus TaxID=2949995 RepID=UPI0020420762|nr:hypothetical protein [Haloplanus sp. HW8-1]
MRRGIPALVVALSLVLAGCAGLAPEASPTNTPTVTPTTTNTPTATSAPVDVEYVVRAGAIPDDVRSVTVTLQVVFVERSEDMGPCWRETFTGPYKPTPTPIAPPVGDCHRSESVTLDLTEVDDGRSLGRITAPGRFDAGHALIVTNVTATHRNGTAVTGIRGASGKRAAVVSGRPAGRHRVTLALESYTDRDYDHWLVASTE